MQLGDLYENDSIFDKFDCCFSGDGTQVATGTYSNCFRVVSRGDGRSGAPGTDQVLEASRDPQRKRLQQTPAKVGLLLQPGPYQDLNSPSQKRKIMTFPYMYLCKRPLYNASLVAAILAL